jgi:hypothetical protein
MLHDFAVSVATYASGEITLAKWGFVAEAHDNARLPGWSSLVASLPKRLGVSTHQGQPVVLAACMSGSHSCT